jgi:uracil-DNA glycosylase
MDATYRSELSRQIAAAFQRHPDLYDHRREYPWLIGALGDPTAGVWFVGENPSLGQVERAIDPLGGRPTEEAQWWASRGDQLFRDLLVQHGFKSTPKHAHGGWQCYITNAIKEADYAQQWRGSPAERRRRAADAWEPVLRWELEHSRPHLVVALGKTVREILTYLERRGLRLPRVEMVQHYSYVALRPRGNQGPMHPERVREYSEEFSRIATLR